MPWTPLQTKFLLSKGSPLSADQRTKMVSELHQDHSLAHARKGSLKKMAAMGAKKPR